VDNLKLDISPFRVGKYVGLTEIGRIGLIVGMRLDEEGEIKRVYRPQCKLTMYGVRSTFDLTLQLLPPGTEEELSFSIPDLMGRTPILIEETPFHVSTVRMQGEEVSVQLLRAYWKDSDAVEGK